MGEDERLSALGAAVPLAGKLGIVLLEAGRDMVRAYLKCSPELCTAAGAMHGGALMALADNCGGVCAFLNLPAGFKATATIASAADFLRAVHEGNVIAVTRPLHRGRTLIVLETELRREDGTLAARVTHTQAFR